MDVRENTTGRDGDGAQKLGEFLIVADGQLDVARDDAGLLVVTRGVASEFENFSGEVLEDGGEVHRSASADSSRITSHRNSRQYDDVTDETPEARREISAKGWRREFKRRLGSGALPRQPECCFVMSDEGETRKMRRQEGAGAFETFFLESSSTLDTSTIVICKMTLQSSAQPRDVAVLIL